MPRFPDGTSVRPVVSAASAEGEVTAAAAAIPVVAARNCRRLSPSLLTSPETLTSLSFMMLLRHCNDMGSSERPASPSWSSWGSATS